MGKRVRENGETGCTVEAVVAWGKVYAEMGLFLAQKTSFLAHWVDHNWLQDDSIFKDAPEAVEKLTFPSTARATTQLKAAGIGREQHKLPMRKWPKQWKSRY